MLVFIIDFYKYHKMCIKDVENFAHALKFARYCYKTQNMFNKDVGTYPSAIQFVPECYKLFSLRLLY